MIAQQPIRPSAAMARLGSEAAFGVLARVRELEAQGRHIVSLHVGEPDFNTPEHVKLAAIEGIEDNQTHYTPSAGIAPLRDTIAAYASKFRGITPPFSRDEVVVSPGLKPMIWNVLAALLDPGDEMIYADPAYPAYESAASYLQAKATPIPLLERNNFALDLDMLAARMSDRTKVLVLNSPHNPTGGVLNRPDLETIAELAIRHDVTVVSDEVYSRILYGGEFYSIAALPGMRERTIVLDGFSKAYAMTGWRLGYALMPEHIARVVALLAQNTYSCTNAFVQVAGIAALDGPDDSVLAMVAEFLRRRDAIVAGLNALPGISCNSPDGAFYVFPNVSAITRDDKKLASFLLEEGGVAGVGGSCFGAAGTGFLRFSYAASLEEIELGLQRMRATLPRFVA